MQYENFCSESTEYFSCSGLSQTFCRQVLSLILIHSSISLAVFRELFIQVHYFRLAIYLKLSLGDTGQRFFSPLLPYNNIFFKILYGKKSKSGVILTWRSGWSIVSVKLWGGNYSFFEKLAASLCW